MLKKTDDQFNKTLVNSTCFICDDIRVEKDNKKTIVGIYPKELKVKEFPITIRSLSIYIDILINKHKSPKKMSIMFYHNNEKNNAGLVNLEKTINENFYHIGIVVETPVLTIEEESSIIVSAEINGEEYELIRSDIGKLR